MRDFKGMKRQRGRNRGGQGGKPQQHNANRAFESNGPDGVKIRGNAQHVFEKYQQLARDAASSGDRVLAENYLQHAEHYFRVIRAVQPNRPASEIIGRDAFSSGFDIDFEEEPTESVQEEAAEGGDGEGGEQQRDRFESRRDDRNDRGDRNNDRGERRDRDRRDRDFNRDRGERRDRDFNRDDRSRDDRPRDDRPRDDRPRDERPRDERSRDDRPREPREDRRERRERAEASSDPMAVVEPQATPLIAVADEAESSPMLRSQDGGVSHAPAFLQPREPRAEVPRADAEDEGEKRPRVRRRRAPRSFEGGEAAPASSEAEEA